MQIFYAVYCLLLKKGLTNKHFVCYTNTVNLGVAQMVARYLGVVEAASSSLVTQTISSVHNQPESWMWTLDFFAYICISLICMSRS